MSKESLVHMNTCPVCNAQLVRFSARIGFVIVSVLVGEHLDIPAGWIKITLKSSCDTCELWKCYDIPFAMAVSFAFSSWRKPIN